MIFSKRQRKIWFQYFGAAIYSAAIGQNSMGRYCKQKTPNLDIQILTFSIGSGIDPCMYFHFLLVGQEKTNVGDPHSADQSFPVFR